MLRLLALASILALAVSACSQAAQPSPSPCPEPTRRSGDAAFDDQNRTTWQKEREKAGPAACDNATTTYVARLDDRRVAQLLVGASDFAIYGRVTDASSGAPVEQVCVTPGKPGVFCWARTDADGWYLLDFGKAFAHEGFFEMFFTKSDYPQQHSISRMLSGRARIDYQMTK
jgi:hypothetical protein